MTTITTREAVRHAARYLKAAGDGATFLVTRRGNPAAILMPAGDHGNRFQAADPIVTPPGAICCPICQSANGCSHPTARCLICGEAGFARFMTVEDHVPHCRGARSR